MVVFSREVIGQKLLKSAANFPYVSSSSTDYLKPEEKIKQNLIQSIEDWCTKGTGNKDQQMVQLDESIDYEIVIDLNLNKTLIKC
jgi:hypothetical protein